MLNELASMRLANFDRRISVLALGFLTVVSLPLGGCSNIGGSLMDARAEVRTPPQRGAYLPVGVTPPPRAQPTMTVDEQARLRNELKRAGASQALAVKARDRSDK